MPIQGPHADSKIRAPAVIKSVSAPSRANIASTCFEPQEITKLTSGWTVLPFKISATLFISVKEELVQLPIAT